MSVVVAKPLWYHAPPMSATLHKRGLSLESVTMGRLCLTLLACHTPPRSILADDGSPARAVAGPIPYLDGGANAWWRAEVATILEPDAGTALGAGASPGATAAESFDAPCSTDDWTLDTVLLFDPTLNEPPLAATPYLLESVDSPPDGGITSASGQIHVEHLSGTVRFRLVDVSYVRLSPRSASAPQGRTDLQEPKSTGVRRHLLR